MSAPSDPLAVALSEATMTTGGTRLKVEQLFGDRPEVIEAIISARRDRKLGYQTIAKLISKAEPHNAIGADAIENFLRQKCDL